MSAAQKTIVYAEDDENDAYFFERSFRRLGLPHRLRIASDGQNAVDVLSAEPADCVVLDLKMPRMTGLDVLQWIRRQPAPLGIVPVVILTSSNQDKDLAVARISGANGFLVKPSNAAAFVPLVRALCAEFLAVNPAAHTWVDDTTLLAARAEAVPACTSTC